jgi:hypothetical protein
MSSTSLVNAKQQAVGAQSGIESTKEIVQLLRKPSKYRLPLATTVKLPIKDSCIQEHLAKLMMARNNPSFQGLFKCQRNNKITNFICIGYKKRKSTSKLNLNTLIGKPVEVQSVKQIEVHSDHKKLEKR